MNDKTRINVDDYYKYFNKMSKQELIRELLYLHETYLLGGEE